jgi:hypothetical protein
VKLPPAGFNTRTWTCRSAAAASAGPVVPPPNAEVTSRRHTRGQQGQSTSSQHPVLLRVEKHGGHALIGATAEQHDALRADELAFLLDQLRASPDPTADGPARATRRRSGAGG